YPAPIERPAFRAAARLAIVEDLEAAEHPRGFLAAAAELPASADPVAAIDRHRLATTLHCGAGEVGRAVAVELVGTLAGQPERHQLADAVVGEIPADRPAPLGQQLDDPQIGQGVDLQATVRARDQQAVKAGVAQLLDQGFRQALLAFDLLAIAAEHRLYSCRGLDHGLRVDICR